MMKKLKTVFVILVLVHGFLFCFPGILPAQVFTFDYLTYSDYAYTSFSKGKLTSFFFTGINEFDSLGNASAQSTSYREIYLYAAPRIYGGKRVHITMAFQIGLLLAEGITSRIWGTPWFWGKFRVLENPSLSFRSGFKWGKVGDVFWLKDNEFDLGMLLSKKFGFAELDATLSYRFRGRSDQGLLDFGRHFNQAGNEIHYKLEGSKKIISKVTLSLLVLGYQSGDKKLNGAILPDSYSRKTTLGATCTFQTTSSRFYALSLLFDATGRYDKKGITFVFNVTD